MRRAAYSHYIVEIQHAFGLFRSHADHDLEPRQARTLEPARLAFLDLRRDRTQLRDVIGRLEVRGEYQRLAANLVEREFKLRHAISRIDIDEDEAQSRSRELRQQ